MDQLEKDLKNYTSAPSNIACDRLDNRLEHKRNKHRIKKFRNISVAAVLISVLAVVGVMSMYIESYNPELFATSTKFEPIMMEDLEQSAESLYNIESLRFLNNTYKKLALVN